MKFDQLKFCSLESANSKEEYLKDVFLASGQWIKKFKLSPSWLRSSLKVKEELTLPLDFVNRLMINPEFKNNLSPKIITDDEHFLVLHKPPQVHCFPQRYLEHDNILSYLRENNYFSVLQVNRENYDRGLLYRLDFETSGLLILGKDESLYQMVRENFHQFIKKKIYLAIVQGDFNKEGDHHHGLAPTGARGQKISVTENTEGNERQAIMKVEKISYNNKHDCSLLKVEILTGHRHQIRAQLSFLGYPILGDTFYNGAHEKRVYLHCYQYEIKIEGKDFVYQDAFAELFDRFFDLNSRL